MAAAHCCEGARAERHELAAWRGRGGGCVEVDGVGLAAAAAAVMEARRSVDDYEVAQAGRQNDCHGESRGSGRWQPRPPPGPFPDLK